MMICHTNNKSDGREAKGEEMVENKIDVRIDTRDERARRRSRWRRGERFKGRFERDCISIRLILLGS